MVKKGLLLTLIFFINGCVGTVKIAKDTEINSRTTKTPVITKNEASPTQQKE